MSALLTVDEAATHTGLSVETLTLLRALGVGPASSQLGRLTVYRTEDLDAWRADLDMGREVKAALGRVVDALVEVGRTFDHVAVTS